MSERVDVELYRESLASATAEVQRLRDQLDEARAAHRNAEEYASEGWAWVETFCELTGVPDVFALRAFLARSERV